VPPLSQTGIPKKGSLSATLRQQADHRFLAQRGISWDAAGSSTMHLADTLRKARAQQRARLGNALVAANRNVTADTSPTPGTWQPLGPAQVTTAAYGAVTGRITSLAANPNDSTGNTLYVGATGGGVWKSTNAAGPAASVSFAPLTDTLPAFSATLPSLSIGALSVQPTSSSVVLAGTGDPNNQLDSYYGVGILRSADAGNTWTLIGGSKDGFNGGLQNYSFTGEGFAGFAWSSVNPSLVVAAVAQSVEALLVNAGTGAQMKAGLYYSADAGQTWYLAVIEDDSTHIIQSPNIAGAPPGNSATSVVWNPVRKRFYAAVRFHGYYESTDGITWTRLANQPGASLSIAACPPNAGSTGQTSCPIFRGVVAAQPVTGDLFALTTDLNNLDQGLFQDVCSPSGLPVTSCASNTVAFANQIASSALENGSTDPDLPPTTILSADYDLTLAAVSSQQDTILFAGTEDIFRCSLANSCAWRNTTNIETCSSAQVAPSQHATESTFGSNGLLYFANDGGLWRSTDTVAQTGSVCDPGDASHYQNLNPGIGSLAEVEHFSVSPASPTTVLAGMGGFGTVSTTSASGAWQQLLTGEGSYTAIDPANTENWYTEAGGGVDILRCTVGAPLGPGCSAAGFGTTPVIGSAQVSGDADYFFDAAPWILDPLNSANVLLGTCRVWRGPASGGWSSADLLSPVLDGNQQPFCNGNAQLRSIAAGLDASGPSGSEQMYAGMAGFEDGGGTVPGHVFTSTVPAAGGLTIWADRYRSPVSNTTNTTQFNGAGFSISSIAVDPHDATGQTVYVTTQGFSGNGLSAGEVYGSTDGGAHWLNLTNTLPLAPANGIVVDPNVPSILYVALDTGVYYTQNVAACSGTVQSCWAVYGSGLPNSPVTSLQVYSAGASSILEASTYGRGIWSLPLLTAPAQGTLTPTSYNFGSQQIATTGASTTFTLTNTGASALTITEIAASANYSQTNTCGTTVAAGATCTIQVAFAPTAAGDLPGTLSVYANVSGGRLTSTLDGTGLTPGNVTVTPASLTFPATVQGASSAALPLSLQNTGGVAVQLQAFSVTTDYQLGSNTCGSTLAPGASCSVGILFTPSGVGDRPGHLAIPSNLAGSPTVVPLEGTGVTAPALTLTPTALAFPNTAQGSTSAPLGITVTSSGGAPAQLQNPILSGDYQLISDSCGSTLAPGATCVLQVAFAPAATGIRAGLLTLPANVSGGQVTVSLSGTGVTPAALTLSPASLTFPLTTQGVPSAAKTLQLTSTGGVSVQLLTPSVTGDYAISSSTCGASLAPGASCLLSVTFTPVAVGDRPGLLTVPGNVSGGHVTAPLDGTGVTPPALTLNPNLLTFTATALNATSPTQGITVSNTGGTAAQLHAPSTTGDFAVSVNGCGSNLAPGGTCVLEITFTPTATGIRSGQLTLSGWNASSATAALSGNGVAVPVVTLNPATADFSTVAQGSSSQPQSFTATNTGVVAVTLQSPTISANYQVSGNACTTTLAPQATCVIMVLFHPASPGVLGGTLTLAGTMAGGQASASLTGTGLAPGALRLLPGTVTFSAVVGAAASTPQPVTVSNASIATFALSAPAISGSSAGDYVISSNNCPAMLAPNQTCTVQITFLPAAAGLRQAQLQMSDDVPGDTASTVSLDGTGQKPGSLAISPSSASFSPVAVGATSSPSMLTVGNSGDVAVNLQVPFLAGDYTLSNSTCGAILAPASLPAANCTLQVSFSPTATGIRPGTLTLVSDAINSPATVALTGVGLAPGNAILAPTSLQFPPTVAGAVSSALPVLVTNSGGATTQLGAAAVSANYQILPAGTTCTGTLAAGASCALQVAFAPAAGTAGGETGTLTQPGQFSGSPATVSLNGQAVAPGALTLSPNSVVFPSVVTGTSSVAESVTLSNSGGVPVVLGAPSIQGDYGLVLNPCPATLAPQASCVLQVVFTPAAAGDRQGLLTVSGNIAGNQVTATLDGIGVLPGALSLSTSLLSFPSTADGAMSTAQLVTITNSGGSYLNMQLPVTTAEYQVASNTCGSILDIGQHCRLGIVFAPTAPGDQPGTLTVSASGGAVAAHATLDGTGLSPARISFAPSTLSFGTVQEGKTSSPPLLATLSNIGGITAQLSVPVLTGDFAVASNSCGATLAPAASCALLITFSPTGAGNRTGSAAFTTTDSSSTATVVLNGTGTLPPALVLSPTALTFPTTAQSATSAAENIVVANVGLVAVTLQAPVVSGDFALSANTCSAPLNPTYSCTLSITFTPTAGGQRPGLLTVSDGTETQTATLTGIGLTAATDTLAPTSLSFSPQVFGTVSPAQSVTLTNSGGSTLGAIAIAVSGPFIATNNCGVMLGGNLSCSIAVSFAPTGAGSETGQLTITDAQRTQTVALAGSGVLPPQAVATPSSLDFGGFAVGVASPVQLVTMTNNGKTSLTGLTAVVGTTSFAVATNSCGDTIGPGSSCTLGISFTPVQPGNVVDVLTLSSPSLNGALTVGLSGSGEDFQLSITGSSSDLVTNGQTATYHLVVTPVGSSAGSLTFTCSGAPTNTACTVNPATVSTAGGATASATVSIATGIVSGAARQRSDTARLVATSGGALALLLPCLLLRGRTRRTFLALLVAGALIVAPTACGVHASGGSSSGGGGSGGGGDTAPGKYLVTLTASFPGATRTAVVTLTVE
jgi:hypothetical protein